MFNEEIIKIVSSEGWSTGYTGAKQIADAWKYRVESIFSTEVKRNTINKRSCPINLSEF